MSNRGKDVLENLEGESGKKMTISRCGLEMKNDWKKEETKERKKKYRLAVSEEMYSWWLIEDETATWREYTQLKLHSLVLVLPGIC